MKWIKIIKQYNEWLTIPIAFALFLMAPEVMRWYDPTAGAFDVGIFHTNFYGIASLFLYTGVAWILLKINFPTLKKFLDDDAEDFLTSGDSKHKWGVTLAYVVFFGIIFLLHLISNSQ